MTKSIRILEVFVACPSDCDRYRSVVKNAIVEVNNLLGKTCAIELRYRGWDESVVPGMGARAQEVINDQVGEDYEILVGILGTKFGTPTGNYKSGTHEEFSKAIDRFKKDGSPEIMIYLDKSDRDPYSLDLDQLSKVKEFVGELRKHGVLTSQFSDSAEFERFLRAHLAEKARLLGETDLDKSVAALAEGTSMPLMESDLGEVESLGLLDAVVIAEEKMHGAAKSLTRISEYVQDLVRATDKTVQDVTNAKRSGLNVPALAKQYVDSLASELDNFSVRTRSELPLMTEQFQAALDAAGMLVSLRAAEDQLDKEDFTDARASLHRLGTEIARSVTNVEQFRGVLLGTPGLTSRYKQAKKQAVAVLDQVITALNHLIKSCAATSELLV